MRNASGSGSHCGSSELALPLLAIVTVQFVFSGYNILTSIALSGGVDPYVFALLRDVIAACCLLGISRWAFAREHGDAPLRSDDPRLTWLPRTEDLPLLTLCAFLVIWAGNLLSALAIDSLGPVVFALAQPSIPVVTLIVGWLMGTEVLSLCSLHGSSKVLGIVLTVAGAVLLTLAGGGAEEVDPVFADDDSGSGADSAGSKATGYVLLFTQVAGAAVYPIYQKRLLDSGYSPITLISWIYSIGAALVALSTLPAVVEASGGGGQAFTGAAIGCLAFAALLASVFNYMTRTWVNAKTGPLWTVMFVPLQPFATALLSWVLLGDTITWLEGVAGLIISVGLVAVVWAKFYEQRQQQRQQQQLALDMPSALPQDEHTGLIQLADDGLRADEASSGFGTTAMPGRLA